MCQPYKKTERIVHMLLNLIILLTYYIKLVYGSCQIETTSAVCETFSDINYLNKSQLITNLKILACHIINEQANSIKNIIFPLTITSLSLENCHLKTLQNIPIPNKNITFLNLSNNNISILPWQYVSLNTKKFELDIRGNYLKCVCDNEWIFGVNKDVKTFFLLPQIIYVDDEFRERCKGMKCVREKIESINYRNNVTFGDEVELVCTVNGSNINQNPKKLDHLNYFRWITLSRNKNIIKLTKNNYLENVDHLNGKIKLKIYHASEDDLGVIACLCLWCKYPLFSLFEIRIKRNLTIDVFNDGRSDKFILQGYPLNNLLFKIKRLNDNVTEKPFYITDKTQSLFNKTLFFKQETTKEDITNFYIRDLRVFPKECTLCNEITWDLIDKEYEINLCNDENCARVKRYIGSLNHTKRRSRNYEVHSNKLNFSNKNNDNNYENKIITTIILLTVIVVVSILIAKYGSMFNLKNSKKYNLWKHYSRRTSKTEETMLQTTQLNITRDNSVSMSINSSSYSLKHVPIIDIKDITIGKKIGQGAYGEVFHGQWNIISTDNVDSTKDPFLQTQPNKVKEVAVKSLRNLNFTADWDREAGLLSQLDNNNIVKFFGVSYNLKNEALIVMEYMNLGDLRNYLIKRSPPSTVDYSQFPPTLQMEELIEISKQICEGVAYLTSRQIVHRDIAARNCLVSGESDLMLFDYMLRPKTTIKISDFGMSRKLYSDVEYYKMCNNEGKLLPCRWLAPECIRLGKFSHYSDVWSLGITIWEIFSYGEVPFKHLNNNEIFSAIINGARPDFIKGAPKTIVDIIDNCLKKEPEERISAIECLTQLNLIT